MLTSKKDQILKTSRRLFYKHGYTATGVERIAREAGTTKATLYSNFHSKEDLIAEVLESYDKRFREELLDCIKVSIL